MRQLGFSLPATVAIAASSAALAAPLTPQEVSAYDFNNNTRIESGAEAQALLNDPKLSDAQRALVTFGVKEAPDGVLVSEIANPGRQNCSTNRKLRLRSGLGEFAVTAPDLDSGALSGASFAYSRDSVANVDNWSASGVLYWAFGDPCAARTNKKTTGAYVSRYGIAPFLEFNGGETTGVARPSQLRFGVLSEFQVSRSGARVPIQIYQFAPYYMTDFDGDANVIGLTASWTPYSVDARLNAKRKGQKLNWIFNVEADFRDVRDGGQTGLTTGAEQGWIGANFGAVYAFQPAGTNGFYGSINASSFRDVLNSDSADHVAVKFGAYLNQSQTSAFEIQHRRGATYTSPVREQITEAGIVLKF